MTMGEFGPVPGTSNTREHKIKAFLAKPPKRAERLWMMAAVDEEERARLLGEWQRNECVPELAPLIVEKLEEHAQEMGGAVTCELSYRDKDGNACGSMMLKRQASQIENASDMALASVQGDARSLVVQAQAQSLLVQKLYVGGMGQVLAMNKEIAERADSQAHRYLRRVVELEHEVDALKEALSAAEEIAAAQGPDGTPGQVGEAQMRALKLFETLAPVLLNRLLPMGPPAQQAS